MITDAPPFLDLDNHSAAAINSRMRAISFLLLFISLGLNLLAADKVATPEALVAELYQAAEKDKSPFFQDKDRALVDHYFTKELADLLWKDVQSSKGEVGALDFDPLFDAQDTEIKQFVVNAAKVESGKASVAVSFLNFDKKQRIVFLLSQQGDAWKISDIQYAAGHALLKLLKASGK